MVAKITNFAVDNGDMTLIDFESGKQLLIDVNARGKGEDPDDDAADVIAQLKTKLKKDEKGRYYVDAFCLSHPDQDHCRGFKKHFYTGPLSDYPESGEKIIIRELWSSPMVFRRAGKQHSLCEDAKAFNTEAHRRVRRFEEIGSAVGDGDRILILGEDENGKTDKLTAILIKADTEFRTINGTYDTSWKARLLAPLPKSDDEEEETLGKNHSSVILRFTIAADGTSDACRYLTAGDAEVAIWERLWDRHEKQADWLSYDMLLTPHHCSWHSLSYDSWSDCGEDAEVSEKARKALSQGRTGATLVASCKPINDDDGDPPCTRAEREYKDIANDVDGEFLCVMEEVDKDKNPIVFEIGSSGPKRTKKDSSKAVSRSAFVSSSQDRAPREVNKQGGGRYA
jgi:hypothetical protein